MVAWILVQTTGCRRRSRSALLATVGLATVAGLASIAAVVYNVFLLEKLLDEGLDERFEGDPDEDLGETLVQDLEDGLPKLSTIGIACGVSWFVVAACLLSFVLSGKYAVLEEKHNNTASEQTKNR